MPGVYLKCRFAHQPTHQFTSLFFSATLLCLSKILYEYNSYLEIEIIEQILEIIVALMESKQREILKGVVSFIKSAIGVVPFQIMEPYVKQILDGFANWDKATKHHFR